MAGPTTIPFGDPKAVKRWSGQLFLDILSKGYVDRKFVSESDNGVIQRLTDLESDAGDTISFDLSVQLRNKPTTGDNRLEGKEENLRFFTDQVYIDQMRHGVSAGGKMSRKRTLHNIRSIAKDRLSDYWSQYIDQMHFIYLSGARGINQDYVEDVTWVGFAGNPIEAPDAGHILYGGDGTKVKNTIVAGDTMSRAVIERAAVKATMMRAVDPATANMIAINIDGEQHYVCVMSPFQEHDLRISDAGGWLDIQKAAAQAEGRNNPIFKGGLGMIDNVVLHSHESVIRFSDYGAGTVPAARALFMGRQAAVCAYGSAGGLRFTWTEEISDHGNEPKVAAGVIMGIKKTRFNGKDFGILSIDTAAKNPNP
jgi:N4-gp56 family major capsid protein